MKIGILTQPLTTNYGGILQNFAMQQVLKRLGHEPVTIRIAHGWQNMSAWEFCKVYPKYIISHILHVIKGQKSQWPEPIWKWRKNVVGFEAFIARNIVTSPFVNGNKLNMDDIKGLGIEALVVGSDQVWHAGLPYMNNVYFCGFAKDSKIKRVAYAASFGFDKWRGAVQQTVEANQLIQEFYAVGIREEAGVELCKQYLGRKDARWVLDPTMLLDKNNYLKLCRSEPVCEEPFVFAYILDVTEEKKSIAESVANRNNWKISFLSVKEAKASDRIEKWLAMFRDAKYIVTDSYHGTVFSLLFQKNFLCIYNSERGNSRMDSLKKITGLESRFIMSKTELPQEGIDYTIVNERIGSMKKDSLHFLQDALKE